MHDFTVLVLEGAYSTSVAATLDILAAGQALASRAGVFPPRWRVCSINGGPVRMPSGLQVATSKLPARQRDGASVWIVPGLGLDHALAIHQRLAQDDAVAAAKAVARHVQGGGSVAASCSAVFLLQAAGVLKGRRATTSWWLAPLLARLEPQCAVDADRMVCANGPIITAGAAFAQTDLMLHLLRQRCGSALVDAISRFLLIDARQAQAPFIIPEVLANGDELVARLSERIGLALPHAPSIAALAQEFHMSQKTLSRHVQRVTGKSTSALVQSVKLCRARTLLESSRMTVDQVAEAVGYQDATALRRLMKRVAGASPSRYRSAASAPNA